VPTRLLRNHLQFARRAAPDAMASCATFAQRIGNVAKALRKILRNGSQLLRLCLRSGKAAKRHKTDSQGNARMRILEYENVDSCFSVVWPDLMRQP
jgi:hypothetical protein